MASLTGKQIKNTYDGLLKTTDSTQGIPSTGLATIQDGLGNDTAMSLGADGNGMVVTGGVSADLTGNVTGNVTGDVTGDVTGNTTGTHKGNVETDQLSAGSSSSITVNDAIKTTSNIAMIGSSLGIGTDAPNRPLHVVGNSRLFGNCLMDKSNSKLGIRRNDPQHPLDVNGTIKSKQLRVGDDGVTGHKRIYTGQLGALGNNAKFIQFGDYGQDLVGDIHYEIPNFAQTTTASFSNDGRLMEDWRYGWWRINPSFWGVGDSPDYKVTTLLSPDTGDAESYILVGEILVFDKKPVNDARRGNFMGPDEDPWISFTTASGAFIYERQIGNIPLGSYRSEDRAWCYMILPDQTIQSSNSYEICTQRVAPNIKMKTRNLNNQVIRPNYPVLVRIKYKRFKVGNQVGSLATQLS